MGNNYENNNIIIDLILHSLGSHNEFFPNNKDKNKRY